MLAAIFVLLVPLLMPNEFLKIISLVIVGLIIKKAELTYKPFIKGAFLRDQNVKRSV